MTELRETPVFHTPVWWVDTDNIYKPGVIRESPSSLLPKVLLSVPSTVRIPVCLPDDNVIFRHPSELYLADSVFGYQDNASLKYLTAPNIVQNVAVRYQQAFEHDLHGIYTFTGWLLIAVNPYRSLPKLYQQEVLSSYMGKPLASVPPHPFAIADAAYNVMLKRWASQSIIISGESGSGKTECSKHVLKYLAYVSDRRHGSQNTGIENRVLQTNPILEAFGNATTVRNTNSSRFGKLIKLDFDRQGRMLGASIVTYLLAKSRVCHVPKHERNYHLFYWMCRAAQPMEREQWKLHTVDYYRYLDSSCTAETTTQFQEVRKAMDAVGLCRATTQHDIFRTLSAILRLGNLDFTEGFRRGDQADNVTIIRRQKPEVESFGVQVEDDLDAVHQLLGLETEEAQAGFELALTSKRIRDTRSNLSPTQAKQSVDSVARCLYQLLFNYVVSRINAALQSTMKDFAGPAVQEPANDHDVVAHTTENIMVASEEPLPNLLESGLREKVDTSSPCQSRTGLLEDASESERRYVGVLDIFGFEDLMPYSPNGFEQLCINYANERLHSFFLHQLMDRDMELYSSEGVRPPGNLEVNRNDVTCSSICNGPHGPPGIVQLLDEASLAPVVGVKDEYFCQKVNTTLGQPERCTAARPSGGVVLHRKSFHYAKEFTVRHFAGDVVYTAEGFNRQNLDFLPVDMREILTACCGSFIVNELFGRQPTEKVHEQGEAGVVKRQHTVQEIVNGGLMSHTELCRGTSAGQNDKETKEFEDCEIKRRATVQKRMEAKSKTLASLFCVQLDGLLATLEETSSWFIRCIKPNDEQAAGKLDHLRVRQQLETGGMVAALRWMAEGYPCRISFRELWARYGNVLPPTMRNTVTPRDFTSLVLLLLGTRPTEFQLGHSRAFFRFGILHEVETLQDITSEEEREKIAQRVYTFWVRKRIHRCLVAVRCITSLWLRVRRARSRRLALEAKLYYTTIWVPRYCSALVLQRMWRKLRAQRILRHCAAAAIQGFCRTWLHRRRYLQLRASALELQSITLGRIVHAHYAEASQAVEVLQGAALTLLGKRKYTYAVMLCRQNIAATRIQRWWKASKDAAQRATTQVTVQDSTPLTVKRRRTVDDRCLRAENGRSSAVLVTGSTRRRSFLDFISMGSNVRPLADLRPQELAISKDKEIASRNSFEPEAPQNHKTSLINPTFRCSVPLLPTKNPRSFSPCSRYNFSAPPPIPPSPPHAPSPQLLPSPRAPSALSFPVSLSLPQPTSNTVHQQTTESPRERGVSETFHTPRELSSAYISHNHNGSRDANKRKTTFLCPVKRCREESLSISKDASFDKEMHMQRLSEKNLTFNFSPSPAFGKNHQQRRWSLGRPLASDYIPQRTINARRKRPNVARWSCWSPRVSEYCCSTHRHSNLKKHFYTDGYADDPCDAMMEETTTQHVSPATSRASIKPLVASETFAPPFGSEPRSYAIDTGVAIRGCRTSASRRSTISQHSVTDTIPGYGSHPGCYYPVNQMVTSRCEIAALVKMPEFRNAILDVLQEELVSPKHLRLRSRGQSVGNRLHSPGNAASGAWRRRTFSGPLESAHGELTTYPVPTVDHHTDEGSSYWDKNHRSTTGVHYVNNTNTIHQGFVEERAGLSQERRRCTDEQGGEPGYDEQKHRLSIHADRKSVLTQHHSPPTEPLPDSKPSERVKDWDMNFAPHVADHKGRPSIASDRIEHTVQAQDGSCTRLSVATTIPDVKPFECITTSYQSCGAGSQPRQSVVYADGGPTIHRRRSGAGPQSQSRLHRVSWLMMEENDAGDTLQREDDDDNVVPIPVAGMMPQAMLQSAYSCMRSSLERTSLSGQHDSTSTVADEDAVSPLLQYHAAATSKLETAANVTVSSASLPLRRSIMITDDILHAKESEHSPSKSFLPPQRRLAQAPPEALESHSDIRPVPIRILPASRIPRCGRKKHTPLPHPRQVTLATQCGFAEQQSAAEDKSVTTRIGARETYRIDAYDRQNQFPRTPSLSLRDEQFHGHPCGSVSQNHDKKRCFNDMPQSTTRKNRLDTFIPDRVRSEDLITSATQHRGLRTPSCSAIPSGRRPVSMSSDGCSQRGHSWKLPRLC